MTLKTTRQAQASLDAILKAWETPESLPAAMAYSFIKGNRYCNRWSLRNQVIVAVMGHGDACTYNGWKKRGRGVRKGEHAFAILKPVISSFPVEFDEEGEPSKWGRRLIGFEHWPVFGRGQTDIVDEELAAKFEEDPSKAKEWVDGLPWMGCAEKWGLKVTTEPYAGGGGIAWYSPLGASITVTATDLRLWAHELVHASDDDIGTLTRSGGQNPDNEIVADMGAAILMTITGNGEHADLAGTREYVNHYLADQEDAAMAAYRLAGRIMDCVENILVTAGQWKETECNS